MTVWASARLTADHDTEQFDSGRIELDRWLRQEAVRAASQGTAVTWVWTSRLAVDRSLHGQGLGGQLLRDALERVVSAADQVGGRLIVVDAIDEAAVAFYLRYDFTPTDHSEPWTYPRRLVMKVATARVALGL